MISTLKNNEVIATGQEEVASMVDSYYNSLLGAAPERAHSINLDLLQLPTIDLSQLEVPFTDEEVEKTIKSMPLDKAPGPDGFTGRFFAACWGVIKEDFMRALECFYSGDMRGLPTINKAIVSLLPKADGAFDIKDFWPVSLLHSVIKIFVKILANRLTLELPRLVGIHQSAFVKGRSIKC